MSTTHHDSNKIELLSATKSDMRITNIIKQMGCKQSTSRNKGSFRDAFQTVYQGKGMFDYSMKI